jgi:aconitate hydratase
MDLKNPFNTLCSLKNDQKRFYYSLPALEQQGVAPIHLLPLSIRILLESLLRNVDGKRIDDEDIVRLANWNPHSSDGEVPFVVSRVILQDFTGVPLLVDLAAMRDAVAEHGGDPKGIEPQVPVDLVVDHSVQVDRAGTDDAFLFNLGIEFQRNSERYEFLKWGQEAFKTFKVIPPGIGIVHQVNLEYLASVVTKKKMGTIEILYPDTLVGTDSHTTMINGLGVVGWGVGGIEAEAAMLGLPVSIPMPQVVGVFLSGELKEGVTATDLTLRITEMLRKEGVVDKFIEFIGPGATTLTVAERATIANMAPEYGATIGYFPVDEKTLDYLRMTGRTVEHIAEIREYLEAQQLFGIPQTKEIKYSKLLELDLNEITACVAGPKRPQDRINLTDLKTQFHQLLTDDPAQGGYGVPLNKRAIKIAIHVKGFFYLHHSQDSGGLSTLDNETSPIPWGEDEMVTNRPWNRTDVSPGYTDVLEWQGILTHGSLVIAAITSCTNTSNPSVMIAAGLVAKRAVEKGLKVNSLIKTSLAPGSRVVTDYLERTGLQSYLDQLGFQRVAYGCTTCIGNSGPLDERIEEAIKEYNLVTVSVLSGNRNFEARIHSAVKANFLMSPPLVVAFALAGRIDIDMEKEPIGSDREGKPVYLKDIWPTKKEIDQLIDAGLQPEMFSHRYSHISEDNPIWAEIKVSSEPQYLWESTSTYIQKPPYFEGFNNEQTKPLIKMRALALFGDSVSTDHISPAGSFSRTSSAGQYLSSLGVKETDFNSYGSRRGNHHVMMRGSFANVRIVNKWARGKEGGVALLMPEEEVLPIFDVCQKYRERGESLIVFAGKDYGMGSSRDWAAKGPALLGVKVVVARSFERIHRSNLIGMGILPLEFQEGESAESLGLTGHEFFSILGLESGVSPKQEVVLEVSKEGVVRQIKLRVRIDTPIEAEYYMSGGILNYVLRLQLDKLDA